VTLKAHHSPALRQNFRKSRNGSGFPERSQTKPAILSQSIPEGVRSKTEAANRFELPGTPFFLVVSLEHPRLDARMFFQPLSNRFHGISLPSLAARFLPHPRQNPPATGYPMRIVVLSESASTDESMEHSDPVGKDLTLSPSPELTPLKATRPREQEDSSFPRAPRF